MCSFCRFKLDDSAKVHHLFYFCVKVDEEGKYDRRTYTAYINSAVNPVNNMKRTYTTMDNFPTTLAAMGVKIEGNRLGLGTNLFSEELTLMESVGEEELKAI